MKKLFIVLLAAVMVFSCVSCKKSKSDGKKESETKQTKVTETSGTVTENKEPENSIYEGELSYSVESENLGGVLDVTLPVFDGANEELNEYFSTLKNAISSNEQNLNYYYMNANGVYEKGEYVGFLITTNKEYTGAAHETEQYNAITFNFKTGEKIMLSDIFTGDYLGLIIRYINSHLDSVPDASVDDVTGYINETNFYLGEDSFTVFFNEREIAPYSSGPQFFEIPYTEMKDNFSEDFDFLID